MKMKWTRWWLPLSVAVVIILLFAYKPQPKIQPSEQLLVLEEDEALVLNRIVPKATPTPVPIPTPTPVILDKLYDIDLSAELQHLTQEVCKQEGIDFELMLGLFKTESDFNTKLVSKNRTSHDSGIGQINSRSAKWYAEMAGIEPFDPLDPVQCIKVSVKALAYHRDYWAKKGFKGRELTIAMLNSYNLGNGGYARYLQTGKLSRGYDRAVRQFKEQLEGEDK